MYNAEDHSYEGPDRVSPFQYKPVNIKNILSEDEKIVAYTLFAMTGPKWYAFLKKL